MTGLPCSEETMTIRCPSVRPFVRLFVAKMRTQKRDFLKN